MWYLHESKYVWPPNSEQLIGFVANLIESPSRWVIFTWWQWLLLGVNQNSFEALFSYSKWSSLSSPFALPMNVVIFMCGSKILSEGILNMFQEPFNMYNFQIQILKILKIPEICDIYLKRSNNSIAFFLCCFLFVFYSWKNNNQIHWFGLVLHNSF